MLYRAISMQQCRVTLPVTKQRDMIQRIALTGLSIGYA
jgi:hypothetical protein